MAGVHYRFVGQNKEFILNTFYKRVVVAARQIGTANAALKQHIAANNVAALFVVKNHVAWRVAGAKNNFQRCSAKRYVFSFFQVSAGQLLFVIHYAVIGRVGGYRAQNI